MLWRHTFVHVETKTTLQFYAAEEARENSEENISDGRMYIYARALLMLCS